MFMHEARLAARLNHPNVVQTYEVGQLEGQPFIAMEFLEGQPLHRLQRAAPKGMPLGIHLRIISEVLAGLSHAHDLRDFGGAPLSVVHRDVSPQNVLVSYEGQAKVVDFGIAKAATHPSYTELGLVKGKLSYMAPEQTTGESLDRRADLFAIGVMLWEAGAGARLWPGESARARLRLLSLGEIPPLDLPDRAVSSELQRICRRALEYSAARRYQTAAELEADLDALRAAPGLQATRRDVAAFLRTHFDDERRRMTEMLDAELASAAAPAAGSEPAPGTRRVRAPFALRVEPEPIEDSATSMAPAMATLSIAAEPRRAGRRSLALGTVGIALALTLALAWPRTSAVSSAGSALGASSIAPLPKPVAASVAPPSESAENAPPATPSAAIPAEPVRAPAKAARVLGRDAAPKKRTARVLDTSDPWAN